MASFILAFQGHSISSYDDAATTGSLDYVVKDVPANSDEHARLIGLLAHRKLIVSDDNGELTITVQPQKEDK